MPSDIDKLYGARAGTQATAEQMSALTQRIAEYVDTKNELDTAEAMVKSAKERMSELKHRALPEAMLAVGLRETVASDGTKVKLTFMTDGSLGQIGRERKLDAIVEFGGDEIVKQMLVIEFPKEFVQHAEELRARIQRLFDTTKKWGSIPVKITRERNVNHQTLCAWVKERMSADDLEDRLPQEFFDITGLWYGEGAKVTLPKPAND
jgi:hypothetical protein